MLQNTKILNVPFVELLSNLFNSCRNWRYSLALFGLVIPVWSIVPISYIYVFQVVCRFILNPQNPFNATTLQMFFFIYALLEVAFSINHHLRLRRIQQHAPVPLTGEGEMKKLFEKCLASMSKEDISTQLPRWFMGAPFEHIQRDNMREWLCWAFCGAKYLTDTTPAEYRSIDEMLHCVESKAQRTFPPGRNPSLKCCRLTLDRVEGMSRPLAFYLAVSAAGLGMDIVLGFLWGFEYHTTREGISYWIWTPREEIDRGKNQKNHKNKDRISSAPIVFVHGIGIGLASYFPFLSSLRTIAHQKSQPLILLTLPHVSMGLFQKSFPDSSTTVTSLLGIFAKHGLTGQKATWVGHSLGTVVVAWVCRERRDVIGSLVLVDPICFRLWDADVCFNFMYKTPARASELLMWYFVAREIGVSAAIGRRFWWFQNVMFPESLPSSLQTHVFLGSEDRIINPVRVRDYLIDNGIPVTTFPALGHAGALVVSAQARKKVLEFILDQQEQVKTSTQ